MTLQRSTLSSVCFWKCRQVCKSPMRNCPRLFGQGNPKVGTIGKSKYTRKMKVPLPNTDAKMLEEGSIPAEPNQESRLQRLANHFNICKWFITINILLLFIFCVYALWSLYQLESAMRSRGGIVSLDNKYPISGNFKALDFNNTVNFDEWRNSTLYNSKNSEISNGPNATHNLDFLMHTITSIVKNFADNDKLATKPDSRIQNNKIIIANLTDFEIHILKELTNLKMTEKKLRMRRTIKGGEDTSKCNIRLSLEGLADKLGGTVVIEPTNDKQETIDITKGDEDYSGKQSGNIRQCSFNIGYKPNKDKSIIMN